MQVWLSMTEPDSLSHILTDSMNKSDIETTTNRRSVTVSHSLSVITHSLVYLFRVVVLDTCIVSFKTTFDFE